MLFYAKMLYFVNLVHYLGKILFWAMNYRKILSLIICLMGVFTASAYEKLSVSTQAFLDNRSAFPTEMKRHAAVSQVKGQEMLDVFISMKDTHNTGRIEALGGVIGARFTDIVTAKVPVSQLEAIAALSEVEQVSIAEVMEADVDSTRSITSVNYAAEGLRHGLPANYDGKGVVFGIIDTGIDFNHAAFQDSLGNCRIKRLYMPSNEKGAKVVIDGTALPGSEFDSSNIHSLTTDYTASAHGSHTAFIGAGSPNGPYSGMAPGADIVMCALANDNSDVNVANSLKYITQYAKSVGKPCVISVSIGMRKGPHDGSSKICQIYDEVGANDAVICLSAGNLGGQRRQIHHKFTGLNTASNPTFGSYVGGTQQAGYTANFSIDTWSRSRSAVGVKYILIDPDDNSIFYETAIMKAYTYHYIGPGNESKRGYNAFLSQYFSGKIGVWVTTESNGHIETYSEVSLKPLNSSVKAYKVGIQFYGANGVEFDSWMNSDHEFAWHPQVGNYKFVAGTDSCSINDNVTGKHTISVGNFVGRNRYQSLAGKEMFSPQFEEGKIYPSSSYGIAPNGNSYPFVAAPGFFVISAYNGYNYLATPSINTAYSKLNPTTGRTDYWGSMSGTSMSTPTVAGIVALWLQANPSLKVNDVKDIIQKSAYVDDDVRETPIQFGVGKINALGGFPEFQYQLTDVINNPRLVADRYYSITDSMLTCMRVSADGRTIYAKDASLYSRQDSIRDGQIDYIKAQGLMPDTVAYDQSNWILLHLPQALDSVQRVQFVGHKLKNVGGVLKDKTNLEFESDKMPSAVMDSRVEPVLNTFIPANLYGSQQVDSADYFFVHPKPMEVDTIRGAYWNATKSQLVMPEGSTPAFQGSARVNFSHVEKPSDTFVVNSYYDFVALTKLNSFGDPVIYPLEIIEEKVSENSLAEVVNTGAFKTGYSYVVNDSSLRVMYVSGNGRTIYAKDDNGYATPDKPASGQVDYLQATFDQSNWVAINLPTPLDETQKASYPGKFLKPFRGMLESKDNPSFTVFETPQVSEKDTAVVYNSFIPANVQGSQELDSVIYFFVRSKPMEIDTIRNVMWNGVEKKLLMPINPEKYGMPAFAGTFKANMSLYETDTVKMVDNYVYDILALTSVGTDGSRTLCPLKAWNGRSNQFTLSQVINDSHFSIGMKCELADSSLVVMYVGANAQELYVKDYNNYVKPDMPSENQVDVLSGKYDQSNWMVLNLPEPLDSAGCANYLGRQISGVQGVLHNKVNPSMDLDKNPIAGEKDTTLFFNTFIPANYYGSQKNDTINYFFVRPKPMEIDTVRCAMWSSVRDCFMMPYFSEDFGYKAFAGSFSPDFSKMSSPSRLNDGDVFDMVVLNDANAQICYPLEILGVKPTEFTLAKILKCPSTQLGYEYPINDNTLTVVELSSDGYTIFAKDDGEYAFPDIPDSTQVDYLGKCDQSNWVAINLVVPIEPEVARGLRGRYLTNLRGMLLSKDCPEMEVLEMPGFGEVNPNLKVNTFLPANFSGSQVVDSVDYFFVRPKPMEIDTVKCAMWRSSKGTFEMPYDASAFGHPQFEGVISPMFTYFEGDKEQFKNGYVYDLLVQTRTNRFGTVSYIGKVLKEYERPSYSLAALLSSERVDENFEYAMKADDLTVMHISPDSLTIYAKDSAKGITADGPKEGQTDYLEGKYAQHNWVAITLPAPLDSTQMADYPGRRLAGFDAVLTSKKNPALKALTVPSVGEIDSIAFINNYLAANFHGSQMVDSVDYYFARPAAMEIDTVRCALWNAAESKFAMPSNPAEWGIPKFVGGFAADLSRLEVDTIPLQDNFVYDIIALNELVADGSHKVYVLEVVREVGGKQPRLGDVNNDDLVDVTDVTMLINFVLGGSSPEFHSDRADIDGNGLIDVTDVTLLISMVLGS